MTVRSLILLLFVSLSVAAQDDAWDDDWADEEKTGLQWSGFIEGALGSRWDTDSQTGSKGTLRELRARFENDWANDSLAIGFKGDALYDEV
ncbi:MAG: hypothetical protein GY826_33710, partial [Fuerstiella sp.]|nr:hypothetical protein [Fuerstiella sp.]